MNFFYLLSTVIITSMSIAQAILISRTLHLGNVAYYVHQTTELSHKSPGIFDASSIETPCTVFTFEPTQFTLDSLRQTIDRFERSDDVWSKKFLSCVVFQFLTDLNLPTLDVKIQEFLNQFGAHKYILNQIVNQHYEIPEGPYFLSAGKLHRVYRLYPDTAGAFIVSTVSTGDPFNTSPWMRCLWRNLSICFDGWCALEIVLQKDSPEALCRITHRHQGYYRLEWAPYWRLLSRLQSALWTKGTECPVVQSLLEQGFIVIGKLKTTQFADSEWPTCDYIDYHGPFNQRGDGYQTPSDSSSGPASAIATYPWLDFSLGTDTLGSIRSPASAQGIVGMRSSLGAASFDGIIPYSPKFDTVGGFARNVESFAELAKALYGSSHNPVCIKKPTKLLYPVYIWPVAHAESQAVFHSFVKDLETYLGVKRTELSLEELWKETKPVDSPLPLKDYFNDVFEWVANIDQWRGFFKDFISEYRSKFGHTPVLNPQLQFKRDWLPSQTEAKQEKGIALMETYRAWFEKNLTPVANEDGCSEALIVLPWSNGKPDYRDKYRNSAQKFKGTGFFFYNVGPYAGVPEVIVSAGQTSYESRLTQQQEWFPAAIGILGARGGDVALANLMKGFFSTRPEEGNVRKTAFNITQDSVSHSNFYYQEAEQEL